MATPESRTLRMIANRSLHLVGIQRRGRLIENQHLGVDNHSAGDGDQLLHRDGDGAQRGLRVEMDSRPIWAKDTSWTASWVFFQSMPQRPPHFVAQHHVLADGQVGAQVDFLVHRGDARVLRVAGAGERSAACRPPSMEPALILYTPVRALIMVDLPAPFSPIRA